MAVAATPRQHLCGRSAPTLARVRGHKQGTAAVGRVFQVGQRGPCSRQRVLQAPGGSTFTATIPWGGRPGLCWLKGIVVCKETEGCQQDGGFGPGEAGGLDRTRGRSSCVNAPTMVGMGKAVLTPHLCKGWARYRGTVMSWTYFVSQQNKVRGKGKSSQTWWESKQEANPP